MNLVAAAGQNLMSGYGVENKVVSTSLRSDTRSAVCRLDDTFCCSIAPGGKPGDVVSSRAADGAAVSRNLLAYVSPPGWEHINLTAEYSWPKS